MSSSPVSSSSPVVPKKEWYNTTNGDVIIIICVSLMTIGAILITVGLYIRSTRKKRSVVVQKIEKDPFIEEWASTTLPEGWKRLPNDDDKNTVGIYMYNNDISVHIKFENEGSFLLKTGSDEPWYFNTDRNTLEKVLLRYTPNN